MNLVTVTALAVGTPPVSKQPRETTAGTSGTAAATQRVNAAPLNHGSSMSLRCDSEKPLGRRLAPHTIMSRCGVIAEDERGTRGCLGRSFWLVLTCLQSDVFVPCSR